MLYRHPYYGPMGCLTKQYCSRQDKQPLLSLKKLVLVASLRWNSKFPIIWLFFQWPLQFCPYQHWHLVLLGLSWSCPLDKQRGAKASWVLDQSTPTEFLLIFNLYLLHCNSIIWIYACTCCTSADLSVWLSLFSLCCSQYLIGLKFLISYHCGKKIYTSFSFSFLGLSKTLLLGIVLLFVCIGIWNNLLYFTPRDFCFLFNYYLLILR